MAVPKRQGQRRQWHPTPVLLPGKSHGQRSLMGCSPWGREESDTTERLHFHFSLSCTGEGNGNPLQCSCLENPRDREAWWVAIYGVAQSQTRLKWLSKRQGRGKPTKMEQRKVQGLKWGPQVEQTALLACLKDVFSFYFLNKTEQIKLSCNTDLSETREL